MDIYLLARVSSYRQEKEETVETQLDYLRRWASLNQHRIVGTYVDEAVSGTVKLQDRPEGSRLLADLPAGAGQAVAVYRIDRLGRSALVIHEGLERFRQAGIEFVSATESFDSSTPIGRMILGFIAIFAEFEREAMKQRCMDGKMTAARKGRWASGKAKYGFRINEEGRLVAACDTAGIIQELFAEVDGQRLGLRRLAAWLERRGIPAPSSRPGKLCGRWHHNTLLKILSDPAYKGAATWGGIEIPCPILVPEDRWERVQRIVHAPERRPDGRRKGHRAYLLTGMIRCGICGRNYQGQIWKNGKKLPEGEYGYICNGKIDGRMTGHRCPAPWLDGEVEQDILTECQAWLDDPARLRRLLSEQRECSDGNAETLQRDKHRLQAQRAALREERATLVTQLGKRRIADADFDRRDAEIQQEDALLQVRINDLESRLAGIHATTDEITEREALLAAFRDRDWGPEEKIRFLVRRIEVFPEAGGGARVQVAYWPDKQHGLVSVSRNTDQTMLLAAWITYNRAA